jgi:hypothetical protein
VTAEHLLIREGRTATVAVVTRFLADVIAPRGYVLVT